MDFLLGVIGAAEWAFRWVLPFILVLSVVVVFHELGHYWVGRLCGVKVTSFSVGFGPEIFSLTDKVGTKWRLSWLPLGGYVSFYGDMGPASAPDRETLAQYDRDGVSRDEIFHYKPLWQRAAIVAAGPVANFILAIVIFASVLMVAGEIVITPRIDQVDEGSPAAEAGFQAGDVIRELQGNRIHSFTEVQQIVNFNAGVSLRFVVERDGQLIDITATPAEGVIEDRFGNEHEVGLLGMSQMTGENDWEYRRHGPISALANGSVQTYQIVTQTFVYLGRVVSGRQDADQLGGPLRIAQVSGQVASVGPVQLVQLIGILSVSIGLINLFPIPILDGGHLVYYAAEGVRGKPLGEGAQEFGFRVGLVVVLSLMIFATWNDLVHLRVFEFLEGIFS